MDIKKHLRQIRDFPKKGILFYDIATLIANGAAWKKTLDRMEECIAPYRPDMLAAIEARGFLVAAPLAERLGCGILMIRKKGKLPGDLIRHHYDLEYGQDTIEVQTGIAPTGGRLVVVDDLIATGGTMQAAICVLIKAKTMPVAAASIIELTALGARANLDIPLESLLKVAD